MEALIKVVIIIARRLIFFNPDKSIVLLNKRAMIQIDKGNWTTFDMVHKLLTKIISMTYIIIITYRGNVWRKKIYFLRAGSYRKTALFMW